MFMMRWNVGQLLDGWRIRISAFSEQNHRTVIVDGEYHCGRKSGDKYLNIIGYESDFSDSFPNFEEIVETEDGIFANYQIWANYDILNEDGTLYLAATDPIPVYE